MQENIKCSELEYKELKNSWTKERNEKELDRFSLKLQCENNIDGLKQGIHDLDDQISHLNEEYKLITGAIELKKSRLDDVNKRVQNVEGEMESIKKQTQVLTTTTSDNIKCRVCDDLFLTRKELSHHVKVFHTNHNKCMQCDKSFSTRHQLEEHLFFEGIQM